MGRNGQMERLVQPRKVVNRERLDRTGPFSFRSNFPEILFEQISPLILNVSRSHLKLSEVSISKLKNSKMSRARKEKR